MTDLELLDYVQSKIVEQGGLSVNDRGTCAYRGNEGRKCAAGQLIPDEKYSHEFEGYTCCSNSALGTDHPSLKISQCLRDCGHNPKAVGWLQLIHDRADTLEVFVSYAEATKKALGCGNTLEGLFGQYHDASNEAYSNIRKILSMGV